ncbi:MAG: nicotinate-nucleotide adenylyltransferase [Thermoleophilaceae bacterium]
MRVGVFGGAFNPPHLGHLVCAQEVLLQLELERVLFVPVREPPHRQLDDDPGGEARLEMVELAIAGDERFAASRLELDREGSSYTSLTLEQLSSEAPDDERFLILGGDQAASLPTWHEPEKVLDLATVAAVARVGWSRSAIGIQLARLRGSDRVRYLDMPLIQISSTGIRRRVREGRPIRYVVPATVEEYIAGHDLYRAEVKAASA